MPDAAVTSKGQITIPAEIRRQMNLESQDRVVFIRACLFMRGMSVCSQHRILDIAEYGINPTKRRIPRCLSTRSTDNGFMCAARFNDAGKTAQSVGVNVRYCAGSFEQTAPVCPEYSCGPRKVVVMDPTNQGKLGSFT